MTQEEIDKYFEEFIYGYICGDLERCITVGKANYLVALGLLSYTEYLGGLKTGNLGLEGKSRENFEEGLSLFDWDGNCDFYKNFKVDLIQNGNSERVGIYKLFRCGLVHEYFGKGLPPIHNNDGSVNQGQREDQGVGWINHEGEKILRFHTNAYYRDFRKALMRFREILRVDLNAQERFGNALARVQERILNPV